MKLGDGSMPPFVGYLPPVVDGVLVELVNMSHPDYPPRRGRSGAQLAEARRLALDSLRMHFKQKPHQRATDVMARAMRERKPYCLYLRSFALGARVHPARNDPFGLPQVVTLMSNRFDLDLQRLVASEVAPVVPALCIRNPAGEGYDLPAFIVSDDEWESLARTLVRNAGLVVVYFRSLTSGVSQEIELLRAAGKQSVTLVVTEEGDPAAETNDMALLTGAQRSEPVAVPASLTDFPHRVTRGGDWAGVRAKLAEMVRWDLSPPVDRRIGLPVEFAPPQELRNHCTDMATKEYDAAHRLIEEKRYEEAEDVLTRSIAYAHWGRDTLGRVMTLVALAQLNLIGFRAKGEAGAYLEMALDVCSEIRATSPSAAKMFPAIEQKLVELRAEAAARKK